MSKKTKTETKSSGSSVKESTTKNETVKDVSTGDVSTEQKPVKLYPEIDEDNVSNSSQLEDTIKNLLKKNEELEKALAYYKDKEKQEKHELKASPEHPLVAERRLKQKERLDKGKIKQAIDILSSVISK